MANPVVYFEVGAVENQPLVEFYGQLFGWEMRSVAPGYTLIDTRGGGGINGGVGRSGSGEPWSTFYVEVDDLAPHSRGVYVNFTSDDAAQRVTSAYTPQQLERLGRLKSAYDPTNFFRLNANIAPA